jgi:hypothetical protein
MVAVIKQVRLITHLNLMSSSSPICVCVGVREKGQAVNLFASSLQLPFHYKPNDDGDAEKGKLK